jgi:hypothetical protein
MGRIATGTVGALVLLALVSSCDARPADSPLATSPVVTAEPEVCVAGSGVDALLVPACGVLLGTIDPPSSPGPPIDLEHQEATVAATAPAGTVAAADPFHFDLVRVYHRGSMDAEAALEARLSEPADHPGRLLFFTWKIDTGPGAWARIAAGAEDEALEAFGAAVAASGRTLFVSLHHEPEGDEEGSPEEYVAMWRHAHDVIEAAIEAAIDAGDGRGSAVWVINYMGHIDGEDLDEVDAYYPGDGYVDWLSYNPYNWAQCRPGAQWRSFIDVATPLYRYLTTAPRFLGADGAPKPIMIGETGSNEDPADPDRKAAWLIEMAAALEDGKLPRIRALVYFNQAAPTFCDRYWDTSAASARAFAEIATHPFFDPQAAPSGTG